LGQSRISTKDHIDNGKLHLIRREEIQLYRDRGKQLLEEHFRLIIAENDLGEPLGFLTDIFDLEAEVITLYYKKEGI
jgi:hypothetical protein